MQRMWIWAGLIFTAGLLFLLLGLFSLPRHGVNTESITESAELEKEHDLEESFQKTSSMPLTPEMLEIIERTELPPGSNLKLSIYDFSDGKEVSYGGDRRFHPASVKKTMYMLMYLEEVAEGRLSLEEMYTLREEDLYGSPVLE